MEVDEVAFAEVDDGVAGGGGIAGRIGHVDVDELVAAAAAAEGVAVGPAGQGIVSAAAVDRILAVLAAEVVVPGPAGERVVAVVTEHRAAGHTAAAVKDVSAG